MQKRWLCAQTHGRMPQPTHLRNCTILDEKQVTQLKINVILRNLSCYNVTAAVHIVIMIQMDCFRREEIDQNIEIFICLDTGRRAMVLP